ncbi:MAG TPA: GNAT family N-acetyltransferase [Phycisphaerae bacterium]|nr:GNAT family N-acetyltransferase [Phycisphaerae bacterium]
MIHVRPGEARDIEAIVALQLRLARETEDLRLDRAVVTRGVRAVVGDPAKGRYWLAEEDGETLGCLLTVPEWSDWRNGTVLWIHSLYVRPESRRRGVFRSLYAHLKGMVEADDSLKGLRLYVNRRNAAAKKVYEAMGMDGQHYEMFEWLA